ncbi:MAG: tetratricopeptide repeat protein [Desulfovibrionaceae bacterium]|nr:tetratricopeptide repeat protein [Desulfovibrionaceae bacterium]
MSRTALCLELVVCVFLVLCSGSQALEHPRVLIQRGERLLSAGRLDAAIETYQRVVEHFEGSANAAEAHNDMGVAYSRKGELDRAIEEYKKGIAINGYPLARFNLGRAYLRKYDLTKDDSFKRLALVEFAAFERYLGNKGLEPVIECQREDIDRFLDQTMSRLRQ